MYKAFIHTLSWQGDSLYQRRQEKKREAGEWLNYANNNERRQEKKTEEQRQKQDK